MLVKRFSRWLFQAQSDRWVSILRIGLGLQLLLYLLSLRRDWTWLLASSGEKLSYRSVAEAMLNADSILIPRVGWFVRAGSWLHISESVVIAAIWWILAAAGLLIVIGLFCRPAAIAAWLLQLAVSKSTLLFSYGADNLTTIGLFYFMLGPLPDSLSLEFRIRNRVQQFNGRLIRRVLQLHLCVIYFFSGLTKSLGAGWWNGSNMLRALTRPAFNVLDPHFLARWHYFLPEIGIATLAIELAYPVLIWPIRTRPVILALIISMHVAIGALMGMYLFASIMIILNLAAFGSDLGASDEDVVSGGFRDATKTIFSRPRLNS